MGSAYSYLVITTAACYAVIKMMLTTEVAVQVSLLWLSNGHDTQVIFPTSLRSNQVDPETASL